MRHLTEIDIAKGIGILLVVIGHIEAKGLLYETIYLFHMPLFFIISGLLFRPSTDKVQYLKKKRDRLITPIVLYSLFLIPFYIVATNIGNIENITLRTILSASKPFNYDAPLWFAPVLFISLITLNYIEGKSLKFKTWIYVTLFITLLIAMNGVLPKVPYLTQILLAILFMVVGYYLKKFFLKKNFSYTIICCLVSAVIITSCDVFGIRFDMNGNIMSTNPLIVIIPALSGTYLTIAVSRFISMHSTRLSGAFSFLGKNSFCVFCLHWPMIKVLWTKLPPPVQIIGKSGVAFM